MRSGIRAFEGFVAVYGDGHLVAFAEHFHAVPFTGRALDLIWPAKALLIAPGVSAGTIEAGDLRTFGYTIDREFRSAHDQNISRAAFNDLRFYGPGPDLIFAGKMNQYAAIPSVGLARRPGLFAPSEFGDQFVIGEVGLSRRQITIMLTADSQDAIGQRKNVVGDL